VGDGVWEARFGVHYIMCVLTPTKKKHCIEYENFENFESEHEYSIYENFNIN
jgi:hypothetical protein